MMALRTSTLAYLTDHGQAGGIHSLRRAGFALAPSGVIVAFIIQARPWAMPNVTHVALSSVPLMKLPLKRYLIGLAASMVWCLKRPQAAFVFAMTSHLATTGTRTNSSRHVLLPACFGRQVI
jgi:hypothetical protein